MTSRPNRRTVVAGLGAVVGGLHATPSEPQSMSSSAELVLYNGRITTLERQKPESEAVAMRDGRFVAVGSERDVMATAGPDAKRIDLKGRLVIPGLIDSHTHVIRGGLNYNMELRWDGV